MRIAGAVAGVPFSIFDDRCWAAAIAKLGTLLLVPLGAPQSAILLIDTLLPPRPGLTTTDGAFLWDAPKAQFDTERRLAIIFG
jgi:hypothetical protein